MEKSLVIAVIYQIEALASFKMGAKSEAARMILEDNGLYSIKKEYLQDLRDGIYTYRYNQTEASFDFGDFGDFGNFGFFRYRGNDALEKLCVLYYILKKILENPKLLEYVKLFGFNKRDVLTAFNAVKKRIAGEYSPKLLAQTNFGQVIADVVSQ